MTAPRLQRVQREDVTLLLAGTGPPDALGDRPTTYTPGTTERALVTPVSAEQAVRAGLTTTVTRLHCRFRAGVVLGPGDRLELRGRTWEAVTCEVRQSYTVVVVEVV